MQHRSCTIHERDSAHTRPVTVEAASGVGGQEADGARENDTVEAVEDGRCSNAAVVSSEMRDTAAASTKGGQCVLNVKDFLAYHQ